MEKKISFSEILKKYTMVIVLVFVVNHVFCEHKGRYASSAECK